jgi:hypothetical protein
VTATRDTAQEAPVIAATVSAWRRLRQSRLILPPPDEDEEGGRILPPPDEDEEGGRGSQATTDVGTMDPPDAISCDFAELQQAGLAAMIALASEDMPSRPLPALPPPSPSVECLASEQGPTSSLFAPSVTIFDSSPPVIGRPRDTVRPGPVTPDPLPTTRARESRKESAAWNSRRFGRIPGLPLIVILTVQVVLSLRLVWSDTAFPDEALYLWAGHLQWANWLHGTPTPAFATFFSGAPSIYPPLGAIADSIGGLAGARLLSLCFMLGATVFLHGATRRIFDGRSAVFAAALFAGLSATQYLGAFATYDGLALLLLALATWLGVRAVSCRPTVQLTLMVATAAVLTLADATKYAAALFNPVVIAVAGLAVWRSSGRRRGVVAMMAGSYTLCVLLFSAIHLGGHTYWQGITTTTLTRASGDYPASFLLLVSGKWIGIVVILAILGTIAAASNRLGRIATVLAGVLTMAAFLVPAEQVRIHTYTSLFKHLGFGAWFACIPAGYAVAGLSRAVPLSKAAQATRVGAAAVCLAALPSIPWAASHFGWPDLSQVIPEMRAALASTHGPVLADDRGNVLNYYLPSETAHRQVLGTFFFTYDDPATGQKLSGLPAYAAAIHARYFSVIMLEFWDTAQTDDDILRDLESNADYQLAATIPYRATGQHGNILIWIRQGRQ